jgi:hypothetical protein
MQPTKFFKSMVLDYFNDMVPANFGFVSKSSLPFWAFGYGLTLTPNQIFSFYCRVANKDNTLFKNSNTFNQIQSALLEVCKNGTAKRLFLDAKYNVAGKTGTSLALNKNGYTDAQYQASFIGYAPAENPKYACMVIIKCHKNAANHFGASVAGPVFKDIMENALKSVISNKFIQEPFEKVMAPDSIQILLSENKRYYHHLEDSIFKLRRDAFERNMNDSDIASSKTVEVVHLSCDQDEAGMISFMKDMKFNFPGVPQGKWQKEKVFAAMAPKGIPNYKLLDATGKIIAEGEEAKTKAKELAHGKAPAETAAK